jgi:DNA-directed RNA polymerase subunit RPC12/RpoP
MGMIKNLANLFTKNSTEKKEEINKISTVKEKIKEDKDLRTNKCPNCGSQLKKIPGAKTKCPHCKKFMYVRTRPKDNAKVVVTEKQAKEIDKEWAETVTQQDWLRKLSEYGITEEYFLEKKKTALEKSGYVSRDRDIIWGIFNELLLKNLDDFHKLKMINYQMAIFLNEEDRDCFPLLREAAKWELLQMKKHGIEKVEILTGREKSCKACQKLDGKVFSIDDALEKTPIPCKDCTFKLFGKNKNFCRCMYVAKVI